MRVVKEAEERKNEILDAAEQLFITKGYTKTTIIDILNAVGIAKGTFYYYFKSKEEVMDAMIERIVENDVQTAKAIALDETLNPVEKILCILISQQPGNDNNKEGLKEGLIEQLNCPENALIHQKSIAHSILSLSPILAGIVQQGIDMKIFHTKHPREIMEFLIIAGQTLFDPSMFQWSPEESIIKTTAFIDTMELLLGAEKGSFTDICSILMAPNN